MADLRTIRFSIKKTVRSVHREHYVFWDLRTHNDYAPVER